MIATIEFDITVEIKRPLDEVWDYMTNPDNMTQWISVIQEVKQEGSGPVGKGSRAHQIARFLGKRIETTTEITDWDPKRKFTANAITGPLPFEQTMAFSREGDLTRVDVHLKGESKGFFRLADPVVGTMARRQFAADYANLKDLLEAGIATAGKPEAKV